MWRPEILPLDGNSAAAAAAWDALMAGSGSTSLWRIAPNGAVVPGASHHAPTLVIYNPAYIGVSESFSGAFIIRETADAASQIIDAKLAAMMVAVEVQTIRSYMSLGRLDTVADGITTRRELFGKSPVFAVYVRPDYRVAVLRQAQYGRNIRQVWRDTDYYAKRSGHLAPWSGGATTLILAREVAPQLVDPATPSPFNVIINTDVEAAQWM